MLNVINSNEIQLKKLLQNELKIHLAGEIWESWLIRNYHYWINDYRKRCNNDKNWDIKILQRIGLFVHSAVNFRTLRLFSLTAITLGNDRTNQLTALLLDFTQLNINIHQWFRVAVQLIPCWVTSSSLLACLLSNLFVITHSLSLSLSTRLVSLPPYKTMRDNQVRYLMSFIKMGLPVLFQVQSCKQSRTELQL